MQEQGVSAAFRRIVRSALGRVFGEPPPSLLLHFATPSTIVPRRQPKAARGVTCGCLGAYAFRLTPFGLRLSAYACLQRGRPYGLRLSACACLQRGRPYGLRLSACGCLVTWL